MSLHYKNGKFQSPLLNKNWHFVQSEIIYMIMVVTMMTWKLGTIHTSRHLCQLTQI